MVVQWHGRFYDTELYEVMAHLGKEVDIDSLAVTEAKCLELLMAHHPEMEVKGKAKVVIRGANIYMFLMGMVKNNGSTKP